MKMPLAITLDPGSTHPLVTVRRGRVVHREEDEGATEAGEGPEGGEGGGVLIPVEHKESEYCI